jgi:hypothetical protein
MGLVHLRPTGVAASGRRDATMRDDGFPEAFAEALSRRGVSLSWLHRRLVERGHPVSPAALSYWRSGRSQPERGTSREALVEIEHLLRVTPGELVSRLGPSRRPGPRPAEHTLRDLLAENPGMERALAELGFEGLYDELVEQVRHLVMDVDADGSISRIQVRAVMQARRDGARRTPLVMTMDERGRVPRFLRAAGCSIGRSATDGESGVHAVELLLDRGLAKGETCPYELAIELPEPFAETWVDHYAARRLTEVLVWVRFDRSRVPTRVERYTVDRGREHSERLELGDGTTAHVLARGFGPGVLGLRWDW